MKYILFALLIAVIGLLVLPIMLFRWDDNGWHNITYGLKRMLDI